jgi:hypothetical protein
VIAASPDSARAEASVPWRAVGAVLLGLAILMRINNALRYRIRLGFDAVENVEYIRMLMQSWSLPAPDAAWATSHPPFYYYLCSAMGRGLMAFSREGWLVQALPLLASLAGIVTAVMAAAMVLRLTRGDERRPVLAGALLLFLPVNIYMSAMVNEEMLAALLTSAVVVAALWRPDPATRPLWEAAAIGALGGLALLTKLSGLLVIASVAACWGLAAWRSGAWRATAARLGLMLCVALLVGGWFYARNLMVYGYLYPQDLSLHSIMFEMPPGQRGVLDYLRLPLATLTRPDLLDPALLHSVWGGTYVTLFFDGHRHFLPNSVTASNAGRLLLTLGLLPTLAFVIGLTRGVRRAWREPGGVDTMLVLLVGATLAGYVAFTLGNPWFATVKASYLLGLSIPFACYASEVLAEWTASPTARSRLVWGILIALLVAVVASFTIGVVFTKLDGPGLPWRALSAAG